MQVEGIEGSIEIFGGGIKNGEFSVDSTYAGYLKTDKLSQWPSKFIWKLKIPIKVLHFLWILLQGKIFTNLQRVTQGLVVDASCPRCEDDIEDVEHLLHGYRHSIEFQLFGHLLVRDWVKLNTDGSRDIDLGTITAGGVLRNHLKQWLRGFVLNKGFGSVLEAELWGMFEGLNMA
ncbi:hypothetical protein Dsin_019687 [Dipteronia sinensis]|uniref:Reverse transcriptase zinc-binding domain-containing protein n=1 Tax=Dipteronia sinensis TaxID=43782 RepID=A0AAE0A7W6_9ROSI|nr:hypothetical protein Dsin_019687 [Dipteronia sinensis]